MLAAGGQVRVAVRDGGARVVTGWDMAAVLALARAMGAAEEIAAELLPAVEVVMVHKLNERANG